MDMHVIDSVCDRYESHYRQNGSAPHLGQWLDQSLTNATTIEAEKPLVEALVRLRLALEAEKSRTPSLAELCQELPRHAGWLRDSSLWTETTSGSGQAVMIAALDRSLDSGPWQPGQTLNHFRLLAQIGAGGMGTVWMAQQSEPVSRRVAIKFVRGTLIDPRVVARFRSERRALANLKHPHIAALYEADQTSMGQPFFAMELVEGPKLVEHAAQSQASVSQCIEWFLTVCQAVHYAHQKGIIHRDLKPSNILVDLAQTPPVAKVIDFGLAKIVEAEPSEDAQVTRRGELLGTLDYMCPEQTRLGETDIDIRADVYALGAVLYEMLTHSRPLEEHQLSQITMERAIEIIRAVSPIRPSQRQPVESDNSRLPIRTVRPSAQRELDSIVMTCLEKDRNLRYGSAAALADDLQRFLNGEPIASVPPSRTYRLSKFIAMHRLLVGSGLAIFFALAIGLAGTTAALLWARWERQQAQTLAQQKSAALDDLATSQSALDLRLRELNAITQFQTSQLEGLDAQAIGQRIRQSLLGQESARLKQVLGRHDLPANSPELVEFDQRLSSANLTDVAVAAVARGFFEPAAETLRTQLGQQPHVQARLLRSMAEACKNVGNAVLAEKLLREAITLIDALPDVELSESLLLQKDLGTVLRLQNRIEDAFAAVNAAVKTSNEKLGPTHAVSIRCQSELAMIEKERDQYAHAETLARECLARAGECRDLTRHDRNQLSLSLASVLDISGKLDEAAIILRQLIDSLKGTPFDDIDLIEAKQFLGGALWRLGKLDEARAMMEQASEQLDQKLGQSHASALMAKGTLVNFVMENVDRAKGYELAIAWRQKALEALGPTHAISLQAEQVLGFYHFSGQEFEQALKTYTELHPRFVATFGPKATKTLVIYANMAALTLRIGKTADGIRMYREIYEADDRSADIAWVPKEYIKALISDGQVELATETARKELAWILANRPARSTQLANDLDIASIWFTRMKLWADARSIMEKVLEVREAETPDGWQAWETRGIIAQIDGRLGKWDESRRGLEESIARLQAQRADIKPQLSRVTIKSLMNSLVTACEELKLDDEATRWKKEMELIK